MEIFDAAEDPSADVPAWHVARMLTPTAALGVPCRIDFPPVR